MDMAVRTAWPYRKDKLAKTSMKDSPPNDWSDLWREEFKGKVAMGGGVRGALTAALRAEAGDSLTTNTRSDIKHDLPSELTEVHCEQAFDSSSRMA
jgi:spermidine/putrescine-binding protein